MASNELAVYQEQRGMATWQEMKEQANVLVKTNFLPEAIKTPEQAMAIMLTGKELGLPPMQAIRGINIIKGNPTIKPEMMLALCLSRIPGFKYEFKDCDNKSATFICNRPSMSSEYVSTFTMEDAKAAQLTGNPSWTKYPGNMLRWRAVANALHVVAPDVLVGVYTPEEVGADVNADGSVTAEWSQQNNETLTLEATVVEDELSSKKQIAQAHALGAQKFGKGDEARKRYEEFRNHFTEREFGQELNTNKMTLDQCDKFIARLQELPDYVEQAAGGE